MNNSQQLSKPSSFEQKYSNNPYGFQMRNSNNSYQKKLTYEDEDQFLLQGIISSRPTQQPENQRTNSYTNPFSNQNRSNINYFQSNLNSFNPLLKDKKQDIKDKLSQFDNDFQELMKLNQQSPQQNKSSIIQPTQKQQNYRKTLSRLSQFFGKSNNMSNSSRKFNSQRHMIPSVPSNKQNKIKLFNASDLQHIQPNLQQLPLNKNELSRRIQKMEIQPQIQFFQTSSQKIKQSLQKNNNDNQNKSKNRFPTELKPIQAKLSQTKKRRQRVTMDLNSLMHMLNAIEKTEDKQNQNIQKRKSRVTMDMKALTNMMIFNDQNQQANNVLKIKEKSRRKTQYFKPSSAQDSVIYQDEREDDFTPLKNAYQRLSVQFSKRKRTQKKEQESQELKREKQVFCYFFQNIQEKIKNKKKDIEQLRKQKQSLIEQHQRNLLKLKPNAKKLSQLKDEEEKIRQHIYQINKRVDKKKYNEYCTIINQFEMKLGIRLHTYHKVQKVGIVPSKNSSNEGFFAQFTYGNTIFRIKRNQGEQNCAVKITNYATSKKPLFLLTFQNQAKWDLYKIFINQKLKKMQTFIEFVSQLLNFCKTVQKFELTLEYFSQINSLDQLQISQNSDKITFKIHVYNEDNAFFVTVNLLDLMENNGITIFDIIRRSEVKIPQSITQFSFKKNKVAKSLEFVHVFVIDRIKKNYQDKMKKLSLNQFI